jgi:hypothetical protein
VVFAAFSSWCEVDGETDGEVLEGLRRLAERGGRGRSGVFAQGKGFNLVVLDSKRSLGRKQARETGGFRGATDRHCLANARSQQERRVVIGLTSEGGRAKKRNDKRVGDSADDGGIHTISSRLLLA